MAAGVVDQLELIQIEVQQRVTELAVLAHALDRGGQPVLELAAVDEAGQRVVARLVVQRPMQPALLADVVEHHDGADQIAGAVADRRRRVLDRDFLAAPVDEHGVLGEPEHLPLAQAAHHRALARPRACASSTTVSTSPISRACASRFSQPVRLSATGFM